MPQISPTSVTPGQDGAPKLYGVTPQENSVPFQEKLSKLFKPQDFVTIKNIDDEPLYWQYMPLDAEHVGFSDDGLQRHITRDTPEMWMIEAGQTEVILGASAYLALDLLYKIRAAKSTLKGNMKGEYDAQGKHIPKNFNFSDDGLQQDIIERAYLGKATPVFNGFDQVDTNTNAPKELANANNSKK